MTPEQLRERCAAVAQCSFDDRPNSRPNSRSGHYSQMDWTDGYQEGTRAAAAAIRAIELPDAGGDMVLVPRVATEAMLLAGRSRLPTHHFAHHLAMRAAWNAMLAAAPEPTVPVVGEVSSEVERLRAFYKVVNEMTCVWAGTDRPSSLHPSNGDDFDDQADMDLWNRFVAARAALGKTGDGS